LELSLDITADQLVERCIQGDAIGFRLLYNQNSQAMYNTALRILNNTQDAEDILQESFIDAFRSLDEFRNRSTFGAWLKRIVINKSINRVKRDRKKWVEVDIEHIDSYAFQDEPEIDEADFVFKVESIRNAIRLLPDGYRTVLSLYLMENYKHDDIAVMLGISPATVRTQYKRAKKKLLEIISKYEST
jgi:RNA polymerase sigma factor (sigma-70 family)